MNLALNIKHKLNKNIDIVKKYLKENNIDVPFYIAGGSIFSILNGTDYNDIDVYFYSESDFNKTNFNKKDIICRTKNAITIKVNKNIISNTLSSEERSDITIQFINRNFGTPEEIFEKFDISCSMIAYTSDCKLIKSDKHSNEIDMDTNKIRTDSIRRYIKYTNTKGALDKDNVTLIKIFNYMLTHFNDILKSYYQDESIKTTVSNVLNGTINIGDENIDMVLYNVIVQRFKDSELMDIFEKLPRFIYVKINNVCDELAALKLKAIYNGSKIPRLSISQEFKNRILDKYPEYFI